MKTLSYLTVPAVTVALLVLGCGQVAPTTPSESEVVLQLSAEPASHPDAPGNCCPEGFVRAFAAGNPADRNGDGLICIEAEKDDESDGDENESDGDEDESDGDEIIDNNAPGGCDIPCIPPCGGGV